MKIIVAVALGVVLIVGSAAAEVGTVNVSYHPGIGYLTGPIMSHEKLVEKHAEKLGLGRVSTTYRLSGGATQSMELVISGTVDFAIAGLTPVIIAWAKTKGEILGVSAANTADLVLVTNQDRIKSVKDFTSADRIAVPAIKSSMQAVALSMAAERELGDPKKLDPITVSVQHPEAVAALLSRRTEITAHFASPPFFGQELKDPGIHRITSVEEVIGSPVSIAAVIARVKFRKDNPRVFQAVFNAIAEANEFITKHPRRAAEIYVSMAKSKVPVEELERQISKENVYTLTPTGVMKFAEFMYRTGLIQQKPGSWRDIFFDTAHHLAGN